MSYLLDTNIIAELRKGQNGHPNVVQWSLSVEPTQLYTSMLVIGEIRHGIALKRRTDPAQAMMLERWLATTRVNLGARVLAVDERVAEIWADLGVPNPVPVIDGLLAATALAHGMTVVSRNVADFSRTGVGIVNPFAYSG